ncbi:porin [Botrimarina colliarenosi]|nr:porin [Botrimarina colliarenosi]
MIDDAVAASVSLPTVTPVVYQPFIGIACEPGDDPLAPRYEVGALFDKGLFIRGVDPERDPYAMYIGGRLQVRHTGFARSAETWTDSAGVTRTIRNRNNFDAERVRLNIQGTAVDPALSYYFILDGDSDGASTADFLTFFFEYEFDEACRLRFGRWKIASDREWLLSSRFLTLADRSMATEYFRGAFSEGVWLLGDFGDGWHYETSFTNGLSTSTRRPSDLDDNLCVAATVFWEPLGDFGATFVDYDCHAEPVVRLGASTAFDKSDDRSDAGFPGGDDNFVRLSDGTRLSDLGVLGPGVQLLGDRVLKSSLDFGWKYRGWFVSAEWFLRSIQDLTATGPSVVSQIDDHGYRCDAGLFLIPKRLDVIGRVSHVSGPFGDAYEYAGGFNWYWGSGKRDGKLADPINKFTFDVTALDGSPVSTTTADLFAGDRGVLFRTQVQIGF